MALVAIIGAGPRGFSVLERLVANLQTASHEATRLAGVEIVVVDPQWPGPGQVWRRDQSPLVLMNTPAGSCTIYTDPSVKIHGPILPGPSLAQWSRTIAPGLDHLPEDVRRLAQAIEDQSFAPRVLYGHYLHGAYGELIRSLPPDITVRHARAEAVDMAPDGNGWSVALSDGSTLDTVTSVILALGHPLPRRRPMRVPGQPLHIPSRNASDAELGEIAPHETVVIRGMGLCAFDYIALLTEGRGGRFATDATGELTYLRSGSEPHLLLGSRRGLPYRGRGPQPDERYQPSVLTRTVVEALAGLDRIDFESDLWPLIAAELLAASGRNDTTDAMALLEACSNPLGDEAFVDQAALNEAVEQHLRADLADALDVTSPFRRLQSAMRLARSTIREQLSLRRVSARTHGPALARVRELLDFSISGPPAHRIAQLLALHHAGIVDFAGPEMSVTVEDDGFAVSSPRLPGRIWKAGVLIDAWLPASATPDADGLIARQAGREIFSLHSALIGGPALAIDPVSFDVLGPDQRPVGRCYALGQVIAPQEWVPVIAPLAGTNSRFLRMTDRAARAVLDGLASRVQPHFTPSTEDLHHAN